MRTSLQAVALGVALLITGTTATVSLSSFTPRINNIPNSQCESAYTTIIKGCQASDFEGGGRCSTSCLQGLVEITSLVQRACNGVDVGETSIIGVFQFGAGIRSLCGVNVVTSSSTTSTSTSTSSTKTTAQTSTQAATSSKTTTTSPAAPPPESSSKTTITTTTTLNTSTRPAESSTSSSQGLVVDPNPTSMSGGVPSFVMPPAASKTAAQPQAPNQQLSNQDSGGGSPFDFQATGASAQLRASIAALVGTAALFVACA